MAILLDTIFVSNGFLNRQQLKMEFYFKQYNNKASSNYFKTFNPKIESVRWCSLRGIFAFLVQQIIWQS